MFGIIQENNQEEGYGQELSLPREDEWQSEKVDIEALLKEGRYALYAKFLEEKYLLRFVQTAQR